MHARTRITSDNHSPVRTPPINHTPHTHTHAHTHTHTHAHTHTHTHTHKGILLCLSLPVFEPNEARCIHDRNKANDIDADEPSEREREIDCKLVCKICLLTRYFQQILSRYLRGAVGLVHATRRRRIIYETNSPDSAVGSYTFCSVPDTPVTFWYIFFLLILTLLKMALAR